MQLWFVYLFFYYQQTLTVARHAMDAAGLACVYRAGFEPAYLTEQIYSLLGLTASLPIH